MYLYVVLFLFQSSLAIVMNDYCKVDISNTPCLYRCKMNARCGKIKYGWDVVTMEQRECILDEHNLYRDRMARGYYEKGNLPQTSNMHVLSYDKEAEFLAGCYLRQCIWSDDNVRLNLKGEQFGQNRFNMPPKMTKNILNCNLLRMSLYNWVDNELKNVNPYVNWEHRYVNIDQTGNLSQALWAKTRYVGCAMFRSHKLGKSDETLDVHCDYLPAGNIPNTPMFIKGKPASRCGKEGPNERYRNLYGKITPITQDTYQ